MEKNQRGPVRNIPKAQESLTMVVFGVCRANGLLFLVDNVQREAAELQCQMSIAKTFRPDERWGVIRFTCIGILMAAFTLLWSLGCTAPKTGGGPMEVARIDFLGLPGYPGSYYILKDSKVLEAQSRNLKNGRWQHRVIHLRDEDYARLVQLYPDAYKGLKQLATANTAQMHDGACVTITLEKNEAEAAVFEHYVSEVHRLGSLERLGKELARIFNE